MQLKIRPNQLNHKNVFMCKTVQLFRRALHVRWVVCKMLPLMVNTYALKWHKIYFYRDITLKWKTYLKYFWYENSGQICWNIVHSFLNLQDYNYKQSVRKMLGIILWKVLPMADHLSWMLKERKKWNEW